MIFPVVKVCRINMIISATLILHRTWRSSSWLGSHSTPFFFSDLMAYVFLTSPAELRVITWKWTTTKLNRPLAQIPYAVTFTAQIISHSRSWRFILQNIRRILLFLVENLKSLIIHIQIQIILWITENTKYKITAQKFLKHRFWLQKQVKCNYWTQYHVVWFITSCFSDRSVRE